MSTKAKILLVEDDVNLGFVTQDNLEMHGYEIVLCQDGMSALQTFQKQTFDLCIFDVMLPKLDGFGLAEKIRAGNQQIPIIFLTAKSLKEDKIHGLKIGGDDYLTKPFSMEELTLKIDIFLKRSKIYFVAENKQNNFSIGEYELDFLQLKLSHSESEQKLTLREAELLRFLAQNIDHVIKREDILIKIWGNDDYFLGRSLDVFISRLRKYLKQDSRIQIENVHSVGFKLSLKK
ncbi:MAG: DNA-binding response regulator [Bacteroidetes bacterium]|nr:MAG: DNA-binding response regulator [Bacteroidota bacterium]